MNTRKSTVEITAKTKLRADPLKSNTKRGVFTAFTAVSDSVDAKAGTSFSTKKKVVFFKFNADDGGENSSRPAPSELEAAAMIKDCA